MSVYALALGLVAKKGLKCFVPVEWVSKTNGSSHIFI